MVPLEVGPREISPSMLACQLVESLSLGDYIFRNLMGTLSQQISWTSGSYGLSAYFSGMFPEPLGEEVVLWM